MEYWIRAPESRPNEFLEWMGAAKEMSLTVPHDGHEMATRLVQKDGIETTELFEKFSVNRGL